MPCDFVILLVKKEQKDNEVKQFVNFTSATFFCFRKNEGHVSPSGRLVIREVPNTQQADKTHF